MVLLTVKRNPFYNVGVRHPKLLQGAYTQSVTPEHFKIRVLGFQDFDSFFFKNPSYCKLPDPLAALSPNVPSAGWLNANLLLSSQLIGLRQQYDKPPLVDFTTAPFPRAMSSGPKREFAGPQFSRTTDDPAQGAIAPES